MPLSARHRTQETYRRGYAAGRQAREAYNARRAADPNHPLQLGDAGEDAHVLYARGFEEGWGPIG